MHVRLLKSIARAQSTFIADTDARAAFDGLLSDVLELSDSEYGFIGEVHHNVDGVPYLKTHAITNIAWNDETREFYRVNAPDGLEFTNLNTLFGAAILSREPVISNAPTEDHRSGGTPEGHPPLNSFLGIPILSGGHLVAMLGIANRPGGYDDGVVEYLYPLTSTIGQLVKARRDGIALRQLEQQLWAAQKMDAIGQLAGGVAHDFNNMLQVIQSYCEIALMETQPGSVIQMSLEQIAAAATRSAALTSQLLAFARRQTSSPVVTSLNNVVPPMMAMLRRLISDGIELELNTSRDLWNVRIDRAQVDQVLANLVMNSELAIEDQGRILIEIRNTTLKTGRVFNNEAIPAGDYVAISVHDDGSGMDQQTATRMFEPFFTTRETGRGTGLGLSTVFGIVSQNHGAIDVQTEPGRGTSIDVYLPRCHEALQTAGQPDSQSEAAYGTETVLFVEDELRILESSTMYLERLGYQVIATSRPTEALALARQHRESIRLLITDVIMPEMNGRDLATRVQLICPDTPCLYISGFTADVIAEHGLLDDGMHFLRKPFSATELAATVRSIIDSRDAPVDSPR